MTDTHLIVLIAAIFAARALDHLPPHVAAACLGVLSVALLLVAFARGVGR